MTRRKTRGTFEIVVRQCHSVCASGSNVATATGAKMEAIGVFLNTTVSVVLMLGGLFVALLVGYAKGFNNGKEVGYTQGFYKGRAAARAVK